MCHSLVHQILRSLFAYLHQTIVTSYLYHSVNPHQTFSIYFLDLPQCSLFNVCLSRYPLTNLNLFVPPMRPVFKSSSSPFFGVVGRGTYWNYFILSTLWGCQIWYHSACTETRLKTSSQWLDLANWQEQELLHWSLSWVANLDSKAIEVQISAQLCILVYPSLSLPLPSPIFLLLFPAMSSDLHLPHLYSYLSIQLLPIPQHTINSHASTHLFTIPPPSCLQSFEGALSASARKPKEN